MRKTEFSTDMAGLRVPAGATETALALALHTGRVVAFNYDGKPRVVEVHAVGTNSKGEGIFRGMQINDGPPTWKLFSIGKISNFGLTFLDSEAPREGYAENDRQIVNIFAQLKL